MAPSIRIPFAALALFFALIAAAAPASAAPKFSVRLSDNSLALSLVTNAPATGGLANVSRIAITLAPGIRLGSVGKTCVRATVERAPLKCPAASKIGLGKARWAAYNRYVPKIAQRIDPTSLITAFNGIDGEVLLALPVTRPLPETILLSGRVERTGNISRLVITVPMTLIAGYDFTPAYLELQLGGPGAAGYVSRSGNCPTAGRPFTVELRYRANAEGAWPRPQQAVAKAAC
ncbi:MAG: hypothetical protein NTV40_10020 [Solirubrobacterales bacterium]|nr:hypothetical protein [Solirubrobacterales bacterium]